LRYAGIESYYQAGRDPAWDHYRVGFVLLAHAIRQAADDGIREYRPLRGAEDYKLRFAVADPGLETVAVARGPLAKAALPALAAMRAAPGPLGATALSRAEQLRRSRRRDMSVQHDEIHGPVAVIVQCLHRVPAAAGRRSLDP
jgi:GNAT acetyltransferase-like protein